jgi:outer membrane lipoprotein-sorting protein
MDETAALVALLYGARSSYSTLRMTTLDTVDQARVHEALERRNNERSRGGRSGQIAISTLLVDDADEDEPRERSDRQETITRLWVELPGRARQETAMTFGGRSYASLLVIDGENWWRHDSTSGATTNIGDDRRIGPGGVGGDMLDPSDLLADRLEVVGRTTVAGRAGIAVRCTPAPASVVERQGHARHDLGDALDVVVDEERGILLRRASLLDDEPISVSEVTEIAFDETLPPDTFVFVSPDGEPARPLHETVTEPRRVPLHEAAAAVSFAVLAPDRLPSGWQIDAMLLDHPRAGQSVSLFARSDDGAASVNANQQPARGRLPSGEGLRTIERGGVDYVVMASDDDHSPFRQTLVLFERSGTRVQLTSQNLDSEGLLTLAERFRAVSPEPPALT